MTLNALGCLPGKDFRTALDDYIDKGIVTLNDWSRGDQAETQLSSHEHCLAEFGRTSRWIAFIDVDEFLFSPKMPSLAEALKPYESHPGVFVNWQLYGSSGHNLRPAGLVIENYTKRAPTNFPRNLKGKSIVNPREAVKFNSAHYFHYRDGKSAVTENFEPVRAQMIVSRDGRTRTTQSSVTQVSVEHLRINHYCVKSQADYSLKAKDPARQWRYGREFFDVHDRNEVMDSILHRYLPDLKAALPRG